MPGIDIPSFVGAFAVGILFVYLMAPTPTVVVKFPTPYNAGKVTYEDKSQTCYQYSAEKVTCDAAGGASVKPQPIVEDFGPAPYDEDDIEFFKYD
jgi:hypothetical protein